MALILNQRSMVCANRYLWSSWRLRQWVWAQLDRVTLLPMLLLHLGPAGQLAHASPWAMAEVGRCQQRHTGMFMPAVSGLLPSHGLKHISSHGLALPKCVGVLPCHSGWAVRCPGHRHWDQQLRLSHSCLPQSWWNVSATPHLSLLF
jgi:hypothetical protein